MGNVLLRRLALPVFVLAAASALAQFPGLSAIPSVEYNPILLINPAVVRELRIPPTTASRLQSAFMDEAMNKVMPNVLATPGKKSTLTPAQRTQRSLAAIAHMEARLASMLTPAQRVRWRQLTLQSIGPSAALQPKVVAGLGLTANQKARLQNALSDANAPVAEKLQGGRGSIQMPEMTRLQNEAKARGNAALQAILTPAQRAKWRAMLGRPMNLSGFLGAPAMGIGG